MWLYRNFFFSLEHVVHWPVSHHHHDVDDDDDAKQYSE